MRERHIAKRKKELDKKVQNSRKETQNAAVQGDNDDTRSVKLIGLKADGMPSREDLLKSLGYQGVNIDLGDAESDA